jgi:hypothetical protein
MVSNRSSEGARERIGVGVVAISYVQHPGTMGLAHVLLDMWYPDDKSHTLYSYTYTKKYITFAFLEDLLRASGESKVAVIASTLPNARLPHIETLLL